MSNKKELDLLISLPDLDEATMKSLAPLFGAEEDDVRYRLIVHKLIDVFRRAADAKNNDTVTTTLFDTYVTKNLQVHYIDHLKNGAFSETHGIPDLTKLNLEVCVFLTELGKLKITDKYFTSGSSVKKTALTNLLEKYNKIPTTNVELFIQMLINAMLSDKTSTGTPILPRPVVLTPVPPKPAAINDIFVNNLEWLRKPVGVWTMIWNKSRCPAIAPDLENKLKALKFFSYRITRLYLKQETQSAKDTALQVNATQTHSAWLDQWDAPREDKYSRDPTDASKLYITDKDGKKVEVQKGSKKYMDLASNDCLDFGLKDEKDNTTGQSCSKFLTECMLLGSADSIKNCKRFMMNETFWSDIKKEVYDDMLPATAEDLLRKFGVKTITEDDVVARKQLTKFQSIEKWIEELKTQTQTTPPALTQAEYELIIKNTRLIEYLKALVNKINSSPAILNENYTGPSSETQPYDPNSNKNTLFWTYGLRTANPHHNQNKVQITRLASVINNNMTGYRQRLGGLGALSGLGFLLPVNMHGGGATPENYIFTFSQLENQYNGLKSQLQAHGKEIDPADDKYIQASFETLKRTEKKLVEVIAVTEKYKNLISVYGNNDPDKLLTTGHLNEFVKARESQFDKTISRQQNIVNVLKTIAEGIPEILKAVKANKP